MLGGLKQLLRREAPGAPIYPGIPDGVVLYVVGDIHGCIEPLRRIMSAIDDDRGRTNPAHYGEIYLGDYVDRGPDSAGVLDLLIERAQSRRAVFIKGNHDLMLEEFALGRRNLAEWLPYGGADTLRSYGATPEMVAAAAEDLPKLIPQRHVDFIAACDQSFQVEDYFFVHAGVRPGRPLDRQEPQDLMWIRDDFLKARSDFGAIVVHGHTPVAAPEFKSNRIGIDTGAYMTGHLTCLRIDGKGPRLLAPGASDA